MARPQKKGIDYFPFDVNFFTFDKKIKILRARYGSDGIVVYIYLLAEIYKDEGYYLKVDDDFNYVISEDLNMSPDKIGQIMNFLLERSLFDNTLFKSDKVLTSRGIQRRFQEAVAKRTVIEIESKYWLLDADETKSFIKCTQNDSFCGENESYSPENEGFRGENDTKKSKVKKSKEDIFGVYCSEDKELLAAFIAFEDMRNKIKKPMTDRAKQMLIKELNKITNDRSIQTAILNQSVLNCWQSVYPLKNQEKKAEQTVKKTAFSNFKEGKTEYNDIEQKSLEKLMNRKKDEADGT